jgi:hypothetical protein
MVKVTIRHLGPDDPDLLRSGCHLDASLPCRPTATGECVEEERRANR